MHLYAMPTAHRLHRYSIPLFNDSHHPDGIASNFLRLRYYTSFHQSASRAIYGEIDWMRPVIFAYCVLTESANACASSHEYNSRPTARTARLGMAYSRCILRYICISYFPDPTSPPDQGAKYHRDRHPPGRAIAENRIVIGLLRRMDMESSYIFRRNESARAISRVIRSLITCLCRAEDF